MPLESSWVSKPFVNSIFLDYVGKWDAPYYTVNQIDLHNLLHQDFPITPASSPLTNLLKAQE